jgi:NADPH2:quinone reductase
MRAVRVHQAGGPEALRCDEVPVPAPGPGQVLVTVEAIGVNFLDCYQRSGLYPIPLPFTAGNEAAGRVAAVGPDVSLVKVGDHVAYATVMGAYAESHVVPAARLVPVPDGMDSQTAAAAILQGMTAHYLACSTYPLKPGDTCLIHAGAGGVGLLLTQVARRRGARVISTVGSAEKAALATEAGADHVIVYTEQDFEAEVKRLTDGRGVAVVYDSVAKATFDKSLSCLAPRGVLALFGQSSGPIPPFDVSRLAKNALFLTRPGLGQYTQSREELLQRAGEVFAWIRAGLLKLRISRTLPLPDAAEAHRLLEARQTTGKVMLAP